MSLRIFSGGVSVALILFAAAPAAPAQEDTSWVLESDMPVEWDEADPIHVDTQVQLAQAAQSTSSRRSSARTTSRAGRTSRVPYMIGDSPFSSGVETNLGFTGIAVSDLELPIFGGNRVNVAENNSTTPGDRALISYRHYNNANQTNVLGQGSVLDLDRVDVGAEASFFDGLVSGQVIVPLLRQLNSDLDIYDDGSISNLPVTDRHGELGNLAFAGKLLLVGRPNFSFSAGMAVNAPTAEDAYITQFYDDPSLVVSASPLVTTNPPTTIDMVGRFDNDTVNLTPFLAWSMTPSSRFFHQGFLQIDAPVNRSDAQISVAGTISPNTPYDPESFSVDERGEIDQQTLMRLNLSFGYWLMQGNPGGMLDGLAGIFEVHYTTTIEDANPFTVPITTITDPSMILPPVPFGVVAGPTNSDFDQVNLCGGLAANLGMLQITNGVIVPVTQGVNRSFDFEYCLQASRRF